MKENKILNFIIKVIKGGLIGIAAVIPGFSGGTIACIIGIYDELIEAISGIRKHFKQSIITLLPLAIGIILFAAAFITPITWGIDTYPLITVSLFAGLLIGGIPSFCKDIKNEVNKTNILCLIIGVILVIAIIIPSLTSGGEYNTSLMNPSWFTYIIMFVLGILGSCALVVPGISGSMILLILGFYNPIMDTLKGFLHSIGINFGDFSQGFNPDLIGSNFILPSFFLLACFGIGIIIGFILISKLMKFLLTKYKAPTYYAILGFILASLVGIYANSTYYNNLDPLQIILAIIMLIAGFVCSFVLSKLAEKKKLEVN